MSIARKHELDDRIHVLKTTLRALEEALGRAEKGAQESQAGVLALQRRIVRKAHDAVPRADDKPIPARIEAGVTSACTAAVKALLQRWGEIKKLIMRAINQVRAELDAVTKKRARLDHAEELHDRGRDGHRGSTGMTGFGPSG
ncbi:hypothetical protein [Jiangella gansuensis]|uniref:hypothetical protein n=1 Tax=Jiangella gansuensis TaxID=281473 RepID=UPI00047DC66C|nr:hypothetical protein [Jiangella gansuensis]